MSFSPKPLVVFEHESVRTDSGEKRISQSQLEALQKFYGDKGLPYYSLIHNGVKFNEHVGVIQIGNTIIEVLPKADKSGDANQWRKVLIGMLRASGLFEIKAPTSSDLKLRTNSILDLYFELFVGELEYLLHHGLSKKYRKTEGNCTAFKGSVVFTKHIQQNLVHQERVYSRYTIFDVHHPLHRILYKTLQLINRLNSNSSLQSRIGALLLNFPEMSDIRVSENLFRKITLNRNTIHYRKAIDIAHLLLLNYHPDISRGNNHVLALMFDMNMLWEKFVYSCLRRQLSAQTTGLEVTCQTRKLFWKPTKGSTTSVIPDILLKSKDGKSFVIDTKWKNLGSNKISTDDLRQLYVYHEYFGSEKVAIIYPGEVGSSQNGVFLSPSTGRSWNKECSLISVGVADNISQWKQQIGDQVANWIKTKSFF